MCKRSLCCLVAMCCFDFDPKTPLCSLKICPNLIVIFLLNIFWNLVNIRPPVDLRTRNCTRIISVILSQYVGLSRMRKEDIAMSCHVLKINKTAKIIQFWCASCFWAAYRRYWHSDSKAKKGLRENIVKLKGSMHQWDNAGNTMGLEIQVGKITAMTRWKLEK